MEGKGQLPVECLSGRRQQRAKAQSVPAGILQIQRRTRSPGGPGETLSLRGASVGLGFIITPIISKLILGGASPLGQKVSNSDNKSR